MYTRTTFLKILKFKNMLLFIAGIFEVFMSVTNIISLTVYYWGDFETVKGARSMPESISGFFIGLIMLLISFFSGAMIKDAFFYSSCFEGDLDGYLGFDELSAVTGKSRAAAALQLRFFRLIYMKNYRIKAINGKSTVELDSKTCVCSCTKCGAKIDKRIYFTGKCEYCGSSDLNATVVTDSRVYSIKPDLSPAIHKKEYYKHKKLGEKSVLVGIVLVLSTVIILILTMIIFENIEHYDDKEYLRQILLSPDGLKSYELIKKDILDTIIWDIGFICFFLPIVTAALIRALLIRIVNICSDFFSKAHSPYIEFGDVNVLKRKLGQRMFKDSICRGYLLNCSFSKCEGKSRIALARKIVKDECPSCAAPITEAVDENYKCKYCGRVITDVIVKK